MPSACCLLALAFPLWPSPARAQPLIRTEHHWAVTVGGRGYGFAQVRQVPGDPFRRTEVWLGRHSFRIRGRAAEALALALVCPAGLVPRIDWTSLRRVP